MNARALVRRVVLLLALAGLLPACGTGGGSGTLTPTVAPGIPQGLDSRSGNQRVSLSWTPSSAAAGYTVKRSLARGGPYTAVPGGTGLTASTYIDGNLVNNVPVYYVVSAVNNFGESGDSAEIQAMPGFVASQVAAGNTHTLVLLSDGTLWAWGQNNYFQLGDGTNRSLSTVAVPVASLTGIARIAAGLDHSLALMDDGTVRTWGRNNSGQLGNGTTGTDGNLPAPVSNLTGVVDIAGGDQHSVALRSDGTVWAWGDLAVPASSLPQQVPGLGGITAVSAKGAYSLALKSDGTVWAWGINEYGQFGIGGQSASLDPVPVQVSNLNGVTAIAAGGRHLMALRSDGTVWVCGSNILGELGTGFMTPSFIPIRTTSFNDVVGIAAGGTHSMVLRADGSVTTWGANSKGELGRGIPGAPVASPGVAGGLSEIEHIVAGNRHNIAIGAGGSVWTWGNDDQGQLGNGSGAIQPIPVPVPNVNTMVSLAAADMHSLAARSDGSVWGWGFASTGELGPFLPLGRSDFRIQIPGLSGMTTVAAGAGYNEFYGHSMFLNAGTGTVFTCGRGDSGQMGNGTAAFSNFTPLLVPFFDGSTLAKSGSAIAAGGFHNLTISRTGVLWTWGSNSQGQLGNGSALGTSASTPVQPALPAVAVSAAAGGELHSLAILGSGAGSTLWAWGSNAFGQLGRNPGVQGSSNLPLQVPSFTGALSIAAGRTHNLALKADGSVWAWGSNTRGEIGDAAVPLLASVDVPVQVPGLSGIVAVAAGAHFSLALDGSGAVWAWGWNDRGQLGDGSTVDRLTPVPSLISGAIQIVAGSAHCLARMPDGSVMAWGYNFSGQIGIGSDSLSTLPFLIIR